MEHENVVAPQDGAIVGPSTNHADISMVCTTFLGGKTLFEPHNSATFRVVDLLLFLKEDPRKNGCKKHIDVGCCDPSTASRLKQRNQGSKPRGAVPSTMQC